MQEMQKNQTEQVGPPPRIVISRPYVFVKCTCLDCGLCTTLMLHMRRVSKGGNREWRCKHCGTIGKLGFGS